MSTNSLGVCSAEHKKSTATQLLHGESRISANTGLEMLCKANVLIWKVEHKFYMCRYFILSIRTDGRICWKVYLLYPFSETEKLPV